MEHANFKKELAANLIWLHLLKQFQRVGIGRLTTKTHQHAVNQNWAKMKFMDLHHKTYYVHESTCPELESYMNSKLPGYLLLDLIKPIERESSGEFQSKLYSV